MTMLSGIECELAKNQTPVLYRKHFFNGLPLPIEKLIYSFINISTLHNLLLTNKYFRKILPDFFRYYPSNFNPFLNFITKNINLSIPTFWQEALKNGVHNLKHLTIQSTVFFSKKELHIIPIANKLEKVDFFNPTQDALEKALALPNLTELQIKIFSLLRKNTNPLISIWNNTSLTKLTIFCVQFEKNLFSYTSAEQVNLPKLKSLSITQTLPDDINGFIGCVKSLRELELSETFIKNETLLKLSNLITLSLYSPTIITLRELENIHSLKNLNITVIYKSALIKSVESLNMFSNIIKKIPNLNCVTIEYDTCYKEYLYSDLDNLHNVHIIFNLTHNRSEIIKHDTLTKIRSLTLKIEYYFNDSKKVEMIPSYHYKDPFHQLSILPGLKDVRVKLTGFTEDLEKINDDDEEVLTTFFNQFYDKISYFEECTPKQSIWTGKIIAQLKNKKLINCTKAVCGFLKIDKMPFSNDEIFQIFPNLTWENLIRVRADQFAITHKKGH